MMSLQRSFLVLALIGSSPLLAADDFVLQWNQVMLDCAAIDSTLATKDQPGPTFTSRAFAITSLAVFDAQNSIKRNYKPYLTELKGYGGADERAAVSAAAFYSLANLYPQQIDRLRVLYKHYLSKIKKGSAKDKGTTLGKRVAMKMLEARADDGSDLPMDYVPGTGPGFHQVDPLNPGQGFLTPQWGFVTPFALDDVDDVVTPSVPSLLSIDYLLAYLEVYYLGGNNPDTFRTSEQTIIGIYWGYDGASGLGTPPRLYNQIVRVIAKNKKNTMIQNARLFALVNMAMADAGVQAWRVKYRDEFWRPIVAIRGGDTDGNPLTMGELDWEPLGAPATNTTPGTPNFTPPFPAYTSGHATFGAAALKTVANFYGTDYIPFEFMSDEFNGINRDNEGNIRPAVVRSYKKLSDAIKENAISRIYLGIHWRFDADNGIAAGTEIADIVTSKELLPK